MVADAFVVLESCKPVAKAASVSLMIINAWVVHCILKLHEDSI